MGGLQRRVHLELPGTYAEHKAGMLVAPQSTHKVAMVTCFTIYHHVQSCAWCTL
jgi:hypothetical protein